MTDRFELTVTGESMWPVLVPGKRYTARRGVVPTVDDIVVATHPNEPGTTIVKRVAAIDGDQLTLVGTVSWSSTFVINRSAILGVVDRYLLR